jgi:OOP family OmpA-OmpF porin
MRRSSGNPVEEFEELRGLLLSQEREQLRDLHDRISDKESRAQDVAGVLPEAVKRTRERGDVLTRALRPAVEGSIRESIETRPQTFVDALHPIVGPAVRRSIAESLLRLLQSRTLVYRVEQVFLVHRDTSLLLLHVMADSAIAKDSDTVAEMLKSIQDFAQKSLKTGEDAARKEFRVGERQVWIAPGRHAYLAAVIQGDPPPDLRTTLEETIEVVHLLKGKALANFKGEPVIVEPFRMELEARGPRLAAWRRS